MSKNSSQVELWWKKGVIYQIYPRSFLDSNNDGIGDIKGIISKLDYLNDGTEKSLGVDAIWISPIYKSPMKDFGYDVSDYRDIDSLFGSMEDFKLLLKEAHKRNIKVIMDLVINHTSDEHPWFLESKKDKNNPKRDWYIWQPRRGRKKPNNWISLFELSSAWWLHKHTDEYYLGTFTRNQPEVNWRNNELKKEMYDMIRYWFHMGIDGFRIDVINWFIKDDKLRNNPWQISFSPLDIQKHIYDRNRPETHEICRELRKISDKYQEKMYVGEVYTGDIEEAISYYGTGNDELHMAFNFSFLFQKWSAKGFYHNIINWYDKLPEGAWPNFTLSNHDQPRHYYRYRDGIYSDARAKIAAAMLLTLKGTPFIYYGEEIGMNCEKIPKGKIQDPVGKKYWPLLSGRDPARTPMQWDNTENAGFSTVEPWLPINSDYKIKNVEKQKNEEDSILNFYKNLIWLRKKNRELSHGNIEFLTKNPKDVLAYRRYYKESNIIIILNFSRKCRAFCIDDIRYASVIFGTHRDKGEKINLGSIILDPYEVIILK